MGWLIARIANQEASWLEGRGLAAPALFMPSELPRSPYTGSSVSEKTPSRQLMNKGKLFGWVPRCCAHEHRCTLSVVEICSVGIALCPSQDVGLGQAITGACASTVRLSRPLEEL
jgi:hypothetical protein